MKKMKKLLAVLLALMLVLQMAPIAGAAEAAQVNAAYTDDPASISASAVGYYWDGVYLYYADGTNVNAYSLKELGVNLTDYNQVHTVTINDAAVAVRFCPVEAEVLSDSTSENFSLATYNNFNMGWDGENVSFSNMTADTTVTDSSQTAPYGSFVSLHDTTFSHAADMVLEQTMRFDALPESGKKGQSFVGNQSYAHGHSTFIVARDPDTGSSTILVTTVQNEGGNLVLYLCNNGQYSAGVSATVDLGKTLGETFQLSIRWNADNSAVVYVDGVEKGSAAAGTAGRPYGAIYARGVTYGVQYSNLTGDCKFTISDLKITTPSAKSVAADTASADLTALVAAIDSTVYSDIVLPEKVAYEFGAMPIYWTSSNPAVLGSDGKVVSASMVATPVTLTATAAGQSVEKTVNVILDPNAAYVEDPASIDAAAAGYYWDGAKLYYADGAKVNAYSLQALGVNLTDYNQVHTVTIDGVSADIKFCPSVNVLSAAASAKLHPTDNFNMDIDGETISFSNLPADTTITDSSKAAPYAAFATAEDTSFSHAADMVLEQTMRFDELPESGKTNQSFVGNQSYAHGHSTFIVARDPSTGSSTILVTTVQNEGGNLVLYLCNASQYSAGVSATVDLGKTLGETFQLSIRWNADNSAVVYVDGVEKGSAAAGTAGRPYGAIYARGVTYGVRYSNLTGGAKFTISDLKITTPSVASIADDTAAADLATLVAAVADKTVGDITLPEKVVYSNGAMPIYWTSSNPAVLDNTGKVVASPEVDTQVTLTATAAGQSVEKTVTVVSNPYVEPTELLVSFPTDRNAINLFVEDKDASSYSLVGTSAANAYIMGYIRTAIDHYANDLILVQDVKIDALPEAAYTYNGSSGNKGLALVLTDRVNENGTTCEGLLAYIINEGGALKLYVDDCAAIDLGKGLGEQFNLMIEWNKDNSAYVYVDGACKGILSDVNCTTNYLGNDNIQYFCNADGNVNITLSNCGVYMGVNDIRNQLMSLTVADVLSGIYTDTITGDLPNYYVLDGRKLDVKWIADTAIAPNGDVTLGQSEQTVTVNARVGGVAIKSAEMTVKAASTVEINPTSGVAHAGGWHSDAHGELNANVLSNFTVDGTTFSFDNTGHSDISGLISTNSQPYAIDHAKYDLLMEQTLNFAVLPENRNGIDVFSAGNGKGYYFFINDRYNHNPDDYYKYTSGEEHMVLATIQNEGGELVLYIAGNDSTATAGRARFYLGKGIGETFTLSTLWTKDNVLSVYVDGVEIGTLANCQRDVTYSGADCGNIGYKEAPNAIAIFTVSDVTIYSYGNLAQVGDETYADLASALAAAESGENKTVTLIDAVVTDEIAVPAGVTLELNGFNVRADNMVSFGNVVDNNAETDARVYITGNMVLAEDNSQIAIYHSEQKFYLFTDMGAVSLGSKAKSDSVSFGFDLDLGDNYANHMLSKPETDGDYTGLTATITLNWTGNEEAKSFVISDELMRKYGDTAFTYSPKGFVTALLLNVTGLDSLATGDLVYVDMTVTSDTGIVMDFEEIVYEIPAAE